MEMKKTILCDIAKCYAVLGLMIGGEPYLIYAGEADGSIRAFHGPDFQICQLISEGGGGTMSLVPIPDREGWFFASRGFYSMVDCGESEIDLVRFDGSSFTLEKIASLPYLHRFGMIAGADGTRYLVAATLHGFKKDKEDWSHPGHISYGVLPDDLSGSFQVEMTQLPGDYHIHHGFCIGTQAGKPAAYTSCQEGVLRIFPPALRGGEWTVENILPQPVSDIAVCDIDGDGQEELAALMPFHGDQCRVYRWADGGYREIYRHPDGNDFYHTVIAGTLAGKPAFIIGARKGRGELFTLSWEEGRLACHTIENGIGPCNGAVLHAPGTDYLLVASRYGSLQQAVYYTLL